MLEFAVSAPFDPAVDIAAGIIPAQFPWLSLSILFPIVGALMVPFIPDEGDGRQVRWFALGIALTTFLITAGAYLTGYCLLYTSPSPRD